MQRSTERILTTHAGSLCRPRPVLELLKNIELHRPVEDSTFDDIVGTAVKEVVDQQLRIGVDIPNDGEVGRLGYSRYLNQRLGGLAPREVQPGEDLFGWRREEMERFPGFYQLHDRWFRYWWMDPEVSLDELANVPGNFERFTVVEPITYTGQEVLQKDLARMKAALAGHEAKEAFISATVPAAVAGFIKDYQSFYPSYEAVVYALADACREEYLAIIEAGFLLQVDYPYMVRPDRGSDLGVESLNYALRGIPEEKIRLHYCTGSGLQPHTSNPSLRENIAPLLLKINAQAYGIEGANPRHEHEWMVWKDIKLPEGKILIPGVVSHNHQVVEHPELVAWRIENFASVVGKENLIAGIDCGFSQNWDARRTHPEVQWAKFESLVEGAAIASKRLWNRS